MCRRRRTALGTYPPTKLLSGWARTEAGGFRKPIYECQFVNRFVVPFEHGWTTAQANKYDPKPFSLGGNPPEYVAQAKRGARFYNTVWLVVLGCLVAYNQYTNWGDDKAEGDTAKEKEQAAEVPSVGGSGGGGGSWEYRTAQLSRQSACVLNNEPHTHNRQHTRTGQHTRTLRLLLL